MALAWLELSKRESYSLFLIIVYVLSFSAPEAHSFYLVYGRRAESTLFSFSQHALQRDGKINQPKQAPIFIFYLYLENFSIPCSETCSSFLGRIFLLVQKPFMGLWAIIRGSLFKGFLVFWL